MARRHLLLALALFAPAPAAKAEVAAAQAPQILPRCAAPEFRLMDYMIGDWDVVETQTGNHFLFNRVDAINGGCAIRESLTMRGDLPGMSITFRGRGGRWFQYYHSPGLHAVLEGTTDADGVNEIATTGTFAGLTGPQHVRQVTRRDAAGRPHQIGYARPVAGGEEQVIWDLTFCPRGPQARRDPPCGNVRD